MKPLHPLAVRFEVDQTTADFVRALFDSRIDTADLVVWAGVLLGVTCGLLGCFIVLRRQSLLGDAIGHSVLPGVCLGFMIAGFKSTPALLAGALVAGLAAAGLIALLQRTTMLKSGECMGAVFTGFYALGVVLLLYIQNGGNLFAPVFRAIGREVSATGGQSGLETFLFGQIVAISTTDVVYMALLAGLAIALVALFWRMLAIASFDESFAFSVGIPVVRVHYLLTVLLTVAIVISVQSVGVVLVAAMLITPAATAYLLTDRLHRMAVLSALFGAVAGVAGAFFSVVLTRPGRDWPTGASMVLSAAALFTLAFLFAPRHGVLPRVVRMWRTSRQTQAENLLRTLYLMAERRAGDLNRPIEQVDRRFGLHNVAATRQESAAHVRRLARLAASRGWIEPGSTDPLILTEPGLVEARRVVRNHRLWELFLAQEAGLAQEQVHADAEYIEHVLPPQVLARLETMLDNPTHDPHGRPIP